MEKKYFINTFSYKLIYVFSIYDDLHKGILKVGETTINTNKIVDDLPDNCDDLNKAASDRIRSYTNTIGVKENLLYTTLSIDKNKRTFKDKDVHKVLINSGVKKHDFENNKNPEEWFETDLQTVINAINATKDCKKSLTPNFVNNDYEPIAFRPEQVEAIESTIKQFKTGNRMLWNAKMRFGKTLSTLEVVKRLEFNKTIILTHRPVVDKGWFEDFTKIFNNSDDYLFGSKTKTTIEELLKSKKRFIYFASIQDLRGSDAVGGKFNKNDIVFNTDWDFVVIDEAHEGTQTSLGAEVLKEIIKEENEYTTKTLFLSGTPFNLLSDFEEKEIYTWDYIMEQQAKLDWEKNHPLETNPYMDLPRLNIYTYDLNDMIPGYEEIADKAFNFREFFRVWTGETAKDGKEMPTEAKIGEFVHKEDVLKFLNLMCKKSETSNYPFSKEEYIENFRHSFWILPGVKEAAALAKMLKEHSNYQMFNIVNAAGDTDGNGNESLDRVNKAIGENPNDTYTITLSCGRLTTGVTVKAWTSVFYLAGSYSTAASNYLQTIFRVQSPANYDGKIKTDCYVFDFAPDRTLKMIAQAGDLSTRAGSTGSQERMKMFLNFCPVISVSESEMKEYNVSSMLQQLKQAYAERVVNNGFDDSKIYNDNLLQLDPEALEVLKNLEGIIGKSKQSTRVESIDINNQGFTNEEMEQIEKAQKKPKAELTEEQKALLEELKEKRKQQQNAISVLRGISIRIPLLIYGANIKENEDITPDNLTEIVDDLSWEEFMPKGVTKDKFKEVSKFYDNEIFIEAGRRIRNRAKYADTLLPVERAKNIAELFSTFKNPDKETVLTPWKTVNKHMGNTLGGYNFFDDKYIVSIEEPRFINNGDITYNTLLNTDSKILEINSKTGLYPLYITISVFKQRCLNTDEKKLTEELMKQLWEQTVEENIFVVCKTNMAKCITNRTLIGFNDYKTNVINIPNINDMIKKDLKKLCRKINQGKKWQLGDENMKFDAVIGNPPYQENIENRGEQPPIYHHFYDLSMELSNMVTLITPARFLFDAGKTPSIWNKKMLNDEHFKVIKYYSDSKEVFDTVDIKGGVAITLWDKKQNFGAIGNYVSNDMLGRIIDKVVPKMEKSLSDIIYSNTSYRYSNLFFEENKDFVNRVSGGSQRYLSSSVFDKFPEVFYEKKPEDIECAKIIGRKDSNRLILYFANKYLLPPDNFKNYKVYLASSNGSGILGEALSDPIIGEPNVGATETFVSFGNFNTKEEAENLIKYIKTKFARIMLGTKKVTQGNKNSKVWSNVPLQDYTNNSDIDWSKSIEEIDKQLYNKYDLDFEEVEYIEVTGKQMN